MVQIVKKKGSNSFYEIVINVEWMMVKKVVQNSDSKWQQKSRRPLGAWGMPTQVISVAV
jgi:hypothetical protein